jgi:hypothetical protein
MESDKITFSGALVSTIEHLEAFHRIASERSLIRKIFGRYKLRSKFPQTRKRTWRGFDIPAKPVVCLARGELIVSPEVIRFKPGRSYSLSLGLNGFRLNTKDILQVGLCKIPLPSTSLLNLNWLRLRTRKGGRLSDLLITRGHYGTLFHALIAACCRRRWNMEMLQTVIRAVRLDPVNERYKYRSQYEKLYLD